MDEHDEVKATFLIEKDISVEAYYILGIFPFRRKFGLLFGDVTVPEASGTFRPQEELRERSLSRRAHLFLRCTFRSMQMPMML